MRETRGPGKTLMHHKEKMNLALLHLGVVKCQMDCSGTFCIVMSDALQPVGKIDHVQIFLMATLHWNLRHGLSPEVCTGVQTHALVT